MHVTKHHMKLQRSRAEMKSHCDFQNSLIKKAGMKSRMCITMTTLFAFSNVLLCDPLTGTYKHTNPNESYVSNFIFLYTCDCSFFYL